MMTIMIDKIVTIIKLTKLSIMKKLFFSCAYIKCFKSAKKNTKNAKLRLLTKEDTSVKIEKN